MVLLKGARPPMRGESRQAATRAAGNSPNLEELDLLGERFYEVREFIDFIKDSKRGILRTHLKARI